MGTTNITSGKLRWDQYNGKGPNEVIGTIYTDISSTSENIRNWYWSSISAKRWTSLIARGLAFLLLLVGITLPLLAALGDVPKDKLFLTQLSVASLVLAGLVQFADRVFGWSSGWMRYMSTVTAMENLTRSFQKQWGKYLVSKNGPLNVEDAHALFDLANGLEQELTKLQADETTKWAVEFNAGIALLDTLIKTQREENDKKLEAVQASQTLQLHESAGAIEVNLVFNIGVHAITIGLDEDTPVNFLGNSWVQVKVTPGLHAVRINTCSQSPMIIERIAEVKSGSLTKLDIVVN
ncbi:TPA: SLATT domain-containing protein [Enterobacter soli]|jgi:hypothetical protein|uniref:SLATT domain-containing protein n=1 Tax=Enterobacter soli TaxID=885040 RepID=UPI0031091A7C